MELGVVLDCTRCFRLAGFPFLGALLAVPADNSLFEIYANNPADTLWTMFFGALWGVGGLTFGLSMRYLGVALGQSIALGTCAGLGTILTPVLLVRQEI